MTGIRKLPLYGVTVVGNFTAIDFQTKGMETTKNFDANLNVKCSFHLIHG